MAWSNFEMDTKAIRLTRLREIIDTRFGGNAGKCADFLGIKRPQMSRWVTKNQQSRQGISEESAREIEKQLGMARGLMDLPISEFQTPEKEEPACHPAHTHPRKLVERLCNLAEGINDLGLMYLIGKAEEIMKQHPHDDGAAGQKRAA